MGTVGSISERKRADGTIAYKAEIVVRKDGKRHKLSQTFDREVAARHWMKRGEEELRKPGGPAKLEKTRAVSHHAACAGCGTPSALTGTAGRA
jgi:hypothetical protein